MEAGTSVTLRALSVDHVQARNLSTMVVPIVVDGIPPAPLPYDGQFIQMDVLSVTRAR